MTASEFTKRVIRSSLRLRRLNEKLMPTGCGSACLVNYTGKTIVLTVAHNTVDQKNWAIETKYIPSLRKTENYQIGAMNFTVKGTLQFSGSQPIGFSQPSLIDFAYKIVTNPPTPLQQELNANGLIKSSVETIRLDTNLQCIPNKELEYGFYGQIKGDLSGNILKWRGRLEMGMKYLGIDREFYLFETREKNLTDSDYEGCSGAPILDSNGELVSLVKAVDSKGGLVRGVKLSECKAFMDIECGNI